MARITIDPVTRIEGHLKIEVEVENGLVTNAWSSGTLFRGIETILQGRSPEDAWLFTQRVCGVCTYVHGVASVQSVENALNTKIPDNARVVRNLLMGGQFVHDHPIHFYHLHGLDWIDVVSALAADPAVTADIAKTISPDAPIIDFEAVKTRLAGFVNSGQLGIFNGGYWGHSAYLLSPEENLLFAAHYLTALRQQLIAAEMHAIFGAKNPHIQSLRVGGVTCKYDITAERISQFRNLLTQMRNFIDRVYIPDVKYIAKKYNSWKSIGGFNDKFNYMSYGGFPLNSSETNMLFPSGVILNKSTSVDSLNLSQISEHVSHSWYSGSALHPSVGQTTPSYTAYDTADKYTWLKAPRYNNMAMEVGPLARVLVAYNKNVSSVVTIVNSFLMDASLTAGDLHSTLGRAAARALETKIIADAMDGWLNALDPNGEILTTTTIPDIGTQQGFGLTEAPRGALGHWINIQNGKIANYQMVVPSTWNLGPRDSNGNRGPVEQSLIGTPVADASKPLEVLRIVHSFDPCLACAVHVIDTKKNKSYTVKVS
jgi:[NiFe] hydrogenase large subunit